MPIPSRFTTADCIIGNTENIHLDNGNSWLFYGKTKSEAEETVELMIEIVKKKVLPYFAQFTNFPAPFTDITLDDLIHPNHNFETYGITKKTLQWVHFKIFLSRLHYQKGNTKLAVEILKNAKQDTFYNSRPKHNEVVQVIDQLFNTYTNFK